MQPQSYQHHLQDAPQISEFPSPALLVRASSSAAVCWFYKVRDRSLRILYSSAFPHIWTLGHYLWVSWTSCPTPRGNVSIPGKLLLPCPLYWPVVVETGSLSISPCCSGTHNVCQGRLLTHRGPPAAASQVLGLKAVPPLLSLYWISIPKLLNLWDPLFGDGGGL